MTLMNSSESPRHLLTKNSDENSEYFVKISKNGRTKHKMIKLKGGNNQNSKSNLNRTVADGSIKASKSPKAHSSKKNRGEKAKNSRAMKDAFDFQKLVISGDPAKFNGSLPPPSMSIQSLKNQQQQ